MMHLSRRVRKIQVGKTLNFMKNNGYLQIEESGMNWPIIAPYKWASFTYFTYGKHSTHKIDTRRMEYSAKGCLAQFRNLLP